MLEMCQTAMQNPQAAPEALQKIAQGLQMLLSHNQEEDQEMGGESEPSMEEKIANRIQTNRGGANE